MAKNKYYAVKSGKTPGIYTTWPECEANVKGFPGAQYKSFKTEQEAHAYLEADDNAAPAPARQAAPAPMEPIPENGIHAYTDGSWHPQCPEHFGYGGVIIRADRKKAEFSKLVHDPEAAKSRNVSGEVMAALQVFAVAEKNGFTDIHILHDYKGVAGWIDGVDGSKPWKANLGLTRRYQEEAARLRAKGFTIRFTHVPGHTGNEFNERADQLANQAFEGML